MLNSRLITLLKTFSKQEMKDFGKFISSPYFSTGRNLKPLYNVLKKYYPSFHSPHFTNENIFKKVNPGKKYEKQRSSHALGVLISEMTLLAEKFLGIEFLQKDEEGYEIYNAFSFVLKKRNLTNYLHKVILKNIERLKKTDTMGFFFDKMYMMNEVLKNIYRSMNKKHEAFEFSQRKSLYLYGSTFHKLRILVGDYLQEAEMYNINTKLVKLFEDSVNAFDTEIFENECYDDGLGTKQQVLSDYYLIKSQLSKDDDESLITAIEFYKKEFLSFRRQVKWNFFICLLNVCSFRKKVFDIKKYSSLGSDLIDFVLDKGIVGLYEGLPMFHYSYNQFFGFKVMVLDSKELKKFIDAMLEKVQKEHRKWLYEYSYAWLSFMNSEFERTLEFLSKFSNQDIIIKNNTTMLKISSLYSLGYTEEARHNLESYEHYARKNAEISEERTDFALLYIRSVRALIKCRTDSGIADENVLNKTIEDNKNRNFGFWFKAEAEKLRFKRAK